jgi:hypothetical protein
MVEPDSKDKLDYVLRKMMNTDAKGILSQTILALTPLYCILCGEAANFNFIVFCLT